MEEEQKSRWGMRLFNRTVEALIAGFFLMLLSAIFGVDLIQQPDCNPQPRQIAATPTIPPALTKEQLEGLVRAADANFFERLGPKFSELWTDLVARASPCIPIPGAVEYRYNDGVAATPIVVRATDHYFNSECFAVIGQQIRLKSDERIFVPQLTFYMPQNGVLLRINFFDIPPSFTTKQLNGEWMPVSHPVNIEALRDDVYITFRRRANEPN